VHYLILQIISRVISIDVIINVISLFIGNYIQDDTFYDWLQFHRTFILPITTKKQVCGIHVLTLVYITPHSELSRNSERALHDHAQYFTKSQVYVVKGQWTLPIKVIEKQIRYNKFN